MDKLDQCYNRGCGQKFDPKTNTDDSCRHHPGAPFFHDAYKGWSCCKKKCTDFTEFLNVKGCTVSKHSNVKPKEPEKPAQKTLENDGGDVQHTQKVVVAGLERPSFDSPMIAMKPVISTSLHQQLSSNASCQSKEIVSTIQSDDTSVAIGTVCKNGGCGTTYEGPSTDDTSCTYHSGVPIFHEGMKYWSCCAQRKTTDFNTFLNLAGCTKGVHLWIKPSNTDGGNNTVKCRWDYHQTGPHMILTVYARDYDVAKTTVELNPVRCHLKILFVPDGCFDLDLELCGIVDVPNSVLTMYPTKLEVKLKKAEARTWNRLEVVKKTKKPVEKIVKSSEKCIVEKIDAVDLSDL